MLMGNKIALTSLRQEDSETLFLWINDPDTVRFNSAYSPIHETGHKSWFEAVTRDCSRIIFGVRLVATGRIIGVIQLVDVHRVHRSAELIIRIGSEADRGSGYGSEAVRLLTHFAFNDQNLQRVWLRVFGDNQRAIRAYEKVGFQKEGLMRQSVFIGGRWHDEVIMALLVVDLQIDSEV
jgi:RimJ/RimL family protein N-acetyltransferase